MDVIFNIEKFKEELSKYGLNTESYEAILKDIDSKIDGENDYDWSELKDKYNVQCNSDTIRKSSSTIFGGKMRSEYEKYKNGLSNEISSQDELDVKIQALRKERIKLQTANVERNRLDRSESRQEMYYEYVGSVVQALTPPEFKPIADDVHSEINYFVGLAHDKHITKLTIVALGDLIQGVLRLSDLKINDSSIVKATVEICRLVANMLNELSAYANISY